MEAYLELSGYNEVRNYTRSERSRDLVRTCGVCGGLYGYRTATCPSCGERLALMRRFVDVEPRHSEEDRLIVRLLLEQFVGRLRSNRERYVARRWLLDRIDAATGNYLRQIGLEMGASPQVVSKLRRRVVRRLEEERKRWL